MMRFQVYVLSADGRFEDFFGEGCVWAVGGAVVDVHYGSGAVDMGAVGGAVVDVRCDGGVVGAMEELWVW
ncbi:Hypothetical predicted protein [Olea europaea subsp. europaea]|uniref:Uncharacterized protein n=1 Tax=Olea europaea subsp. europaea TaxID=158383 RepID=A0A8S0U8H7_OLEEU|nr:Hypothetical predicted protein [Olea europaea subsp. europaea]